MTPAQEAALRLLTCLPVRTHYAKEVTLPAVVRKKERNARYYQNRKEAAKRKTLPGRQRAVEVGGKQFDSVTQAIKMLKMSPKNFYRLVDSGQARLVDRLTGTQLDKRKYTSWV